MRMLLTSNGLGNDDIRGALIEMLGRPLTEARIAVVIDAILPFPGDNSTFVDHLAGLRDLGWAEFDVVSLLAAPRAIVEDRLRSADVILGYGGSHLWLAHAWMSTGLRDTLRELLEQKVYIGWSAGSMIFSTRQTAAVAALGDSELELFGLAGTEPVVPLFDWFVLGHLGAAYFPHQTDDWARSTAARLGTPIWFLDDDSALLIRDPAKPPEVVSTGHWLHVDGAGHVVASA